MPDVEITPLPQSGWINPLAADHHHPDAVWQCRLLLVQEKHKFVPERRRQVEYGDFPFRQHAHEGRERAGMGRVVENQCRAGGQRGQDLLEAGVPTQRGELEHAVLGGEREEVAQRAHRDG